MANQRLCSIPGCGKLHNSKSFCNAHYLRLRKYGTPTGGSALRDAPLRWVDDVAMFHTSDECLTWPFSRKGHGYGQIQISGKKVNASRYVCELAHGESPTPEHQAAHSCGKGHEGCVNPRHLEWKTPKQNQADRLEHGTHNRGERNGSAKLTENDVLTILSLKGKTSQRKLAARFGVSPTTIAYIHTGSSWSYFKQERWVP